MTYIRRVESIFPSRQMSFQRNDFMNSNSNSQNNNKEGRNQANNFDDILKKEVVKQKVKKFR